MPHIIRPFLIGFSTRVKLGIFVEQDCALTVARPIVPLSHAAGFNGCDRPIEAVEIAKDLPEAFRPMGQFGRGYIVKPAPELRCEHALFPIARQQNEKWLNQNPDRDLGEGLRVGYDWERAT